MEIRKIEKKDKKQVLEMMQIFYNSPAVHTNGSQTIYNADVEACLEEDNPFLEGFVFEQNGKLQGYGMIAKSFSTEFGKPCVWIEDIYVLKEFRGLGIGSKFINFVIENNPNAVIRLEAEEENKIAVGVYKKAGFITLPYLEMIKL